MKTLDAHSLHVGIHELLRKLSDVKTQMDQVQRAVKEISALEDSLMGKGGTAIRSFFEECHDPFLQVFASFSSDFETVLRNITNALQSLDSAHNALISQSFLENDLKNGLKKAKTVTVELTNEANDTMERVSDIISLPRLNDAVFLNETEQAQRQADRTLDRLIEFDVSQANALETIEEQVLTMKQYIQTIEQMFQGGRLSVTGYEPGLLLGKPESNKKESSDVGVEGKGSGKKEKDKIDLRALKIMNDPYVAIDPFAPIGSIGNATGTLTETYAYTQTAYNTKVKGFNIVKRGKGKNKVVHVSNGKVANIKGSKYQASWIDSQIKRGHTPEIANHVKPKTVLKNALKSKVGYAGIAVTTTENLYKNIKNDAPASKIIGDAIVDVGTGGITLGIGAVAVSAVAGFTAAPVLAVAATGLLVSMGASYVLEGIKVGKSKTTLSEKLKGKVASWFKKDKKK